MVAIVIKIIHADDEDDEDNKDGITDYNGDGEYDDGSDAADESP